ncbi:MAG: DpnD/PcfM family protein [Lachnospiraceae bacterium]|nr:DpnD/PcfM family protein [Lachnospiraceae bacterium]
MKTRETGGNAKGRTFRVTITETLKRTVTVHESELKEPTALDAEQTARDWWRTGQIVLMAEDFSDVDFSVEECGYGIF